MKKKSENMFQRRLIERLFDPFYALQTLYDVLITFESSILNVSTSMFPPLPKMIHQLLVYDKMNFVLWSYYSQFQKNRFSSIV